MNLYFMTSVPKSRQDVLGQHLRIAAGYIQIAFIHQSKDGIVESDTVLLRSDILGQCRIVHGDTELDLVDDDITSAFPFGI